MIEVVGLNLFIYRWKRAKVRCSFTQSAAAAGAGAGAGAGVVVAAAAALAFPISRIRPSTLAMLRRDMPALPA